MIKKLIRLFSFSFILFTSVSYSNEWRAQFFEKLTIYVPGSTGGGYHHTAKKLKQILLAEKFVDEVEIVHLSGAGGVIALTYFVNHESPDEVSIMLGGRSMIGASIYNNASVSLLDTIPIARINAKPLAIAVPQDSPIKSINGLLEAMRLDLNEIKWIGGSAGAVDNVFLKDMLELMNLEEHSLNYQPVPGGGSSIAEQFVEGNYTAAISTFDELKTFNSQGKVRIVAISSEKPFQGLVAPTLKESGIDLKFLDWHGVFVSKNSSEDSQNKIALIFDWIKTSDVWQETLKEEHWIDNFLAGDEFATFIADEQASLSQKFAPKLVAEDAKSQFNQKMTQLINNPYRWAAYIAILCAALIVLIMVIRKKNRLREKALEEHLRVVEKEKQEAKEKLEEKLNSVSKHIENEFAGWGLTTAEKEIALMLLKGLTFKEIAEIRCKSERTVRQQAGAIYSKSGLANRSDLSAYFLEDFM